jgi:hypothetical protein
MFKSICFLFIFCHCICTQAQTIEYKTGGGNLNNGLLDAANIQRIVTLQATGSKMVRVNLYPNDYWNFTSNLPKTNYADSLLLNLASKNIHVVLIFEHYANFVNLGYPLGNYSKWFQIGKEFAFRYKPGGSFFTTNGFPNYGVQYYTAINEPDIGGFMPKTIMEGPENYHDALEGLADGVHNVAPSLKVMPGGFASENSAGSHTLNGFGTAIADLFNNGKLYGLDLHTYNDLQYAPILKFDNTNHVNFMPYYDFSEVKKACGITADIQFCPTEYGFKENTQGINASLAAKRTLTCIWGNLGAVKNDSTTSATEYALIWNLYNTLLQDPVYGMCNSQSPYSPTLKGQTHNLVISLASGMNFIHLDPFKRGEYILNGGGKTLWVFQNYKLLSNITGTSYTVQQIPSSATELKVYNWSGLIQTIPISNLTSYTVTGLNQNETYMFVANAAATTAIAIDEYSSIEAYPNPFSESFSIKPEGHSFTIYDASLKPIQSIHRQYEECNLGRDYPSGIYYIIFENNKVMKIVKQ